MIKAFARTTVDGTSVVILGMARRETELLHEGVPVRVDLAKIDPRLPEVIVVLMAGESDEALAMEVNGAAGYRLCEGGS